MVNMKIDLGCGQNKREGFTGVDSSAECGADIVHDLSVTPWPFESDSIEEAHSSHFVEHLAGPERCAFFNELYRVMKPGAKATIIVPYAYSARAIQDWTHAWPPIHEASLYYLSKAWRDANKLGHYHPLKCDFEASWGFSFGAGSTWAAREESARGFALMHYQNVADDLYITLTKKEIVNG
jgi:predicted SAM-dependent methyltransferase